MYCKIVVSILAVCMGWPFLYMFAGGVKRRIFPAWIVVGCILVVLLLSADVSRVGAQSVDKPTGSASVTLGARPLPLPGELFKVENHEAWLIPVSNPVKEPTQRQPWVFFAHTLRGGNPRPVHAGLFKILTDKGIAVAGIDVGESFGNPAGRKVFTALYKELVQRRHFAERPCLLAQSRGGLQLYNWAAEHPEWIAGIAGVFPVADITRYPGLQKAHKAYGKTVAQLKEDLALHNPVQRLKPLADAHVPILLVHGDKDSQVPLSQHSAVVAKRYAALGGDIKLVVLPGKGHDLIPEVLENDQLVAFIEARAKQ
jgi:dipeptidyl aminopeptidase/acylaminoacyl peptidase